jgi:hypothetical protein
MPTSEVVLFGLVSLSFILGAFLFLLIKKGLAQKGLQTQLESDLRTASSRLKVQEEQLESVRKTSAALLTESQTLSKYRHIASVDLEASRIKASTIAEIGKIRAESEALVTESRAKADAVIQDAREQAASLIGNAHSRATALVDEANVKAKEIAGEALETKENARNFEKIVRAMKSRIEGYGNDYLIPSSSFLDDLAEQFSFADAGQKLKEARDVTRRMVKDRRAATCEYVEENRRDTAVDFVVDAFNGKVDSILSRVKNDNAGTLEQQVRDAFTLVNHNGRAFRNAEISEAFLKARLAELKWAAVAQELKLRDQEEQRRIREQIREEERANKEYERAIRDAEKEEDGIKKAIDKVRRETEKASAEQRQEFEAQLAELSQKLREAEEKNQRALSMAQQTRAGHVYVISNVGSFGEDVVKIGMTRRLDPQERVRELGDASVPFSFDVHAMIYSEDAPALEKSLHTHFLAAQVNKVNPRKEFFRLEMASIRAEIEKKGIKAAWTLAAEAREYRETQALERVIEADPVALRSWAETQERTWKPTIDPNDDAGAEEAAAPLAKPTRRKTSKAA